MIRVQHSADDLPEGSEGWQYVPELVRNDDEPLIHKRYGDSFEATDLESVLAERGVGRLVVTGARTDACVRMTLHGALVRGYDATLMAHAHTTGDMRQWGAPMGPDQAIEYANLYWQFSSADGRTGSTATTAEIDFAAP